MFVNIIIYKFVILARCQKLRKTLTAQNQNKKISKIPSYLNACFTIIKLKNVIMLGTKRKIILSSFQICKALDASKKIFLA